MEIDLGRNRDLNSDVMDDDDVVINLSKEDVNRDFHEEVKNQKECDGEQDGNKTKDNRFVLGVKLLKKGHDRRYVEDCDNRDSSIVQSNRLKKIYSSDLGIEYGCDGSPLMERTTESAKNKLSVLGFGRVFREVGAKGVAIVEETELFGHSSLDMVMSFDVQKIHGKSKSPCMVSDNVLGSRLLRSGRLGMHLSVDKIDIAHIKFNLKKKLFLRSLKVLVGSFLLDLKEEFCNKDWDEGYLAELFIFGLQSEIRNAINMFKPRLHSDAYHFARFEETTNKLVKGRTKASFTHTSYVKDSWEVMDEDDDDVVINLSKEDVNRDFHEEVKNQKECDEEQDGNKTKDNRFVLGVKLLEKGHDRRYVEDCDNRDSSIDFDGLLVVARVMFLDKKLVDNGDKRVDLFKGDGMLYVEKSMVTCEARALSLDPLRRRNSLDPCIFVVVERY
nr:hypothetical protein [Tanacetum cinerariifolium]